MKKLLIYGLAAGLVFAIGGTVLADDFSGYPGDLQIWTGITTLRVRDTGQLTFGDSDDVSFTYDTASDLLVITGGVEVEDGATFTGAVTVGDGTGAVTFNSGTYDTSNSDDNIVNVGDIELDSISPDGTAITICATAADDVTIGNSTGIVAAVSDNVDITLTDTTDDVFRINNSGGAVLMDIDLGAADAIAIGSGVAEAITVQGTTVAITGDDDISLTLTSGAGGEDILITQNGGNDSSITLTAAGTGSDAIGIQATAGGVDIDAIGGTDGDITIDAGDDMTITTVGTLAIDTADWDIDATGIMSNIGTIGCGKVSSTAGVDLGTSQALTGTTGLTIGAGTETVAIDSSDWDIDATGIMSGIGTIACGKVSSSAGVDLGTSQALTGTTALTIGAGTETVAVDSSDWDIDATGVITGAGNITSDGTILTTGIVNVGGIILNLPISTGLADGTDFDIDTAFSLDTGLVVSWVAFTDCAASATLSIDDGSTDKALFNSNDAGAVAADDILTNAVIWTQYDGTQWQIISGNNSN